MRTKFKAWTEPYMLEHPEVMEQIETIDYKKNIYLEIGSGKGLFLLNMAKNNPDKYFLGVERNVTCSGITAKKLVDEHIENAKLLFSNVDQLLLTVPDNSIEGIFLNFSDPWPKKRHEKRRLTHDKYLKEYFRILKPKGKVFVKTDNVSLYEFSLETIANSSFKMLKNDPNYDGKEEFDTPTEYENNFRAQGMPIHRIILEK